MVSLHMVMRANGVSCLGFGLLFAFFPAAVVRFLSADDPAPVMLVLVIGLGLIGNGVLLFWSAKVLVPKKMDVLFFSIGDFIWVVFSLALVITGMWVDSVSGVIATLAVAFVVLLFGVLQISARQRLG